MQKGFTIAEALIGIGILGVICAILMIWVFPNMMRNDTVEVQHAQSILSGIFQQASATYGDLPTGKMTPQALMKQSYNAASNFETTAQGLLTVSGPNSKGLFTIPKDWDLTHSYNGSHQDGGVAIHFTSSRHKDYCLLVDGTGGVSLANSDCTVAVANLPDHPNGGGNNGNPDHCIPAAPKTRTTAACPAGQTGTVTQQMNSSCPGPVWGDWETTDSDCVPTTPPCNPLAPKTRTIAGCPSGETGTVTQQMTSTCPGPTWGDWTTVSSNCTPVAPCNPLAPKTRTIAGCPSGETGTITQKMTSTCPGPTWGDWTTVSSNCTPVTPPCNPLPPKTRTIAGCPTGQTGTVTQQMTSTCPGPTWSGWVTTSKSCQVPCTPLAPKTRTIAGCPTGQTGTVTQQMTSTCPGPTWGNWVTISKSCQVPCTPLAPKTRTTQDCPAGQTGTVTQKMTSTCPGPTWGDWVTTSSTCKAESEGNCSTFVRTCFTACRTNTPHLARTTRTGKYVGQEYYECGGSSQYWVGLHFDENGKFHNCFCFQ